jgi:hypothetical protein
MTRRIWELKRRRKRKKRRKRRRSLQNLGFCNCQRRRG